jgi:TolB protein
MNFVKVAAALLGLLALATSASAQRAPVLRQIKVPHSYYFREMYLPQVTSGPSAVAWSPDGTELICEARAEFERRKVQ